jgi:hypothetical protein
MTINGTNFHIQQKGVTRKGNLFGSHKYAGKSALHYKLGVDILAWNLVRVKGLYPPGAWPSIKIFNSVLLHCLELGEHVEAGNGYVGHPHKIKCPQKDCYPAENLSIQSAARSPHETFKGSLNNWGIQEKTYRHDITVHGTVFTCAQ